MPLQYSNWLGADQQPSFLVAARSAAFASALASCILTITAVVPGILRSPGLSVRSCLVTPLSTLPVPTGVPPNSGAAVCRDSQPLPGAQHGRLLACSALM